MSNIQRDPNFSENESMDELILRVEGLSTDVGSEAEPNHIFKDINLKLFRGKTHALVGESGSGKSMIALSLMRLLPNAVRVVSGNVLLSGRSLLDLPELEMRKERGGEMGMIFQEPMTSLNPVIQVGEQVAEAVRLRNIKLSQEDEDKKVIELFHSVGIPDPERRLSEYPHQLSGGLKQRVMIAMALAGKPKILIADEPTTALDVTIQSQVLQLLKRLQTETGMAILFITHDLGVVAQVADHVSVVYKGRIVETGSVFSFFKNPTHPFSKKLFDSIPKKDFFKSTNTTKINEKPLLAVKDLKVYFPINKGILKRTIGYVKAVDGVSLKLYPQKTLAIVGESGCGKTTMGKAILQLIKPTAGSIIFDGNDLRKASSQFLRKSRSKFQIIFQDPASSMNPRMLISDIILEGLQAQKIDLTPQEKQDKVINLLKKVGLSEEALTRYPHEFSGGQKQRIAIARALAVSPSFVVCDEPTSALDMTVQAQVLDLLKELQDTLGLSYLFITHNMSIVSRVADEVAVMYQGKIVEYGPVKQILETAKHPYTKSLIEAIPLPDPSTRNIKIV
tara:strand:+ start:1408 stop:3096 length:1689 start_codon:yes stop_codon:yes gene_type:complete